MSRRTEQIAEAIKVEISGLIQRELKDPRLGFVTVTRVEVSPDMKYARVFFSALGESNAKTDSLAVLKHASSYLRRELSHKLTIRHIPEIYFVFDEAMEHGEKIQRLLQQIAQEEEVRPKSVATDSEAK